ncbi:MAG: peptidoglycan-binding domain-containing protein [Bryobacteraceae bacterium]
MAKATSILAVLLALGLMAAGVAQTSRPGSQPKFAAASKPKAAAAKPSPKAARSPTASASSKAAGKTADTRKVQSRAKSPAKAAAKTTNKGIASKAKTQRRVRPAIQQQPTPERYREIQQALIDRGFLEGEPTGRWDPASVEALKRFQADQQLQPTGKIDALSLIRLGLGPRRQNLAVAPAPPQPSEVQAEP